MQQRCRFVSVVGGGGGGGGMIGAKKISAMDQSNQEVEADADPGFLRGGVQI